MNIFKTIKRMFEVNRYKSLRISFCFGSFDIFQDVYRQQSNGRRCSGSSPSLYLAQFRQNLWQNRMSLNVKKQRKSSSMRSKRNWSRWRIQEEAFSTSRFDFVDFVKVCWQTLSRTPNESLASARIQWAHEPRYQNTWRTWFRPMSLLINQLSIEDWKERMKKLRNNAPH